MCSGSVLLLRPSFIRRGRRPQPRNAQLNQYNYLGHGETKNELTRKSTSEQRGWSIMNHFLWPSTDYSQACQCWSMGSKPCGLADTDVSEERTASIFSPVHTALVQRGQTSTSSPLGEQQISHRPTQSLLLFMSGLLNSLPLSLCPGL
jgi:hypothetical protein